MIISVIGMTSKKKWRGIETTIKKKNERDPKTITNRLGQKSISLPRIDDGKRWAGYPGLAGTAKEIASIIEKKMIQFGYYIEPFAGTAKVYQELDNDYGLYYKSILNDKSPFIYKWLQEQFSNSYCNITNDDFSDCIKKHANEESVLYLIDPPWNKSFYDQKFSWFDRDNTGEYYTEILKLMEKVKGKFIITTREDNRFMRNSGYETKIIKSIYVVSGKYPKVMLTTNLEGI